MLHKFFWTFFALIILSAAIYLVQADSPVPLPPPGSFVSLEPADTESPYRTAYFTNLTRAQIMDYYKNTFSHVLTLNHPPEEAARLIRDQTRSSWLEELHNPGKSTLYINGFYPTKATDEINRGGQKYAGKITIRYIPSSIPARLTSLSLLTLAAILLIKEYRHV